MQLRGLFGVDKEVLLDMEMDAKGTSERQPVMQLVRQIMADQRVMGIKLWKCIAMHHNSTYEGSYTNGKGCEKHKNKASEFGGALRAHIRYLCLGKGMTTELVNQVLARCFTGPLRRKVNEVKFIWGKVYTARQANFQADLDAMKHGWLDVTK